MTNLKTEQSEFSSDLNSTLPLKHRLENNSDIDLGELWSVVWLHKWTVILITLAFSISSIGYALYLPNVYKSEALLAPAEQESSGLSGMAAQLGGLASIAGVNLGDGGKSDKMTLTLEIMKSRTFLFNFIEKHNLKVPLMAVRKWDRSTNELIYDEDIYDVSSKEWIRDVKAPFKKEPSLQEVYKKFRQIMHIRPDKTTSMVSISIEYYSPYVAKEWVTLLIDAINEEMKQRDLMEAYNSIKYLKLQISKTKIAELNRVMYQLIEEQSKTVMFANVREQYVLQTIDPALVPEIKNGPKRPLICILGALLGGILSVLFVLIRHFSRK